MPSDSMKCIQAQLYYCVKRGLIANLHWVEENKAMLATKSKKEEKVELLERAERISHVIVESGVPQTAIARACKVRPQAVFGWKTTGKIENQNLKVLAQMTGYNFMYLLDGEGPKKPGEGKVSEDHGEYNVGLKSSELIGCIQSGKISEDTVVSMWPLIEKLMEK